MNCKNCGAELSEGSVFCGNCGIKVAEEPAAYEIPAQPVYEAPSEGEFHQETYENYQEQGYYQAPPIQQEPVTYPDPLDTSAKPNTVLWIVLTAVEIFTCCQIGGIVGLIFAILAHVSAERGDYYDAERKLKGAKISFWVGLGLGLLFVVFYVIYFAIFAAAGIAGLEEFSYYY